MDIQSIPTSRARRSFTFAAVMMVVLTGHIMLPSEAAAQSLTVGTAAGAPGANVNLTVSFTPGSTGVSTMQFDLTWSPASVLSYTSTATGGAASAAGKSASGSPISSGVRVLVFGLNQNTIGSGSVAIVTLTIPAGTPPGVYPMSIGGITASDPGGSGVTVSGTGGSVTVSGASDSIPPNITISSPTSGSNYSTSSSSLSISGTASDNVGVTQVTWANNRGGGGTAAGTTSWSAGGISLQSGPNVITVTARDAANNTGTDTLTVTYTPSDSTPPTLTITSPTSNSGFSTSSSSVSLAGSASDNIGVTLVTWVNSRGGSGTANGTTGWNTGAINLSTGTNVLTVIARDAANNTGTDTLTVTFASTDSTPPVISGVQISGITSSAATISWNTDEASDSQIDYGTTTSYGSSATINPSLVTSHFQILTNLLPDTTYNFQVKSRDGSGNLGVSGNFTFRTSAESTSNTEATLSFPHLLTANTGPALLGEDNFTGVAIANLESVPATLTFTAYDTAGKRVSGSGISNPVTRVLAPRGQLPIVDFELFGDGLLNQNSVAWTKIESDVPKVAGFFLMFDGDLTVLDGADIAPTPLTTFVFPEIEDQGFTRLSITNPNSDPATLTFFLFRADGSIRDSVTRNVKGNGALVAEVFADLFPDSTPVGSDYIRVDSDQGVLPFELLGKASQYIEGLNGQDANVLNATTLYSPQYVVGGPWRSTLSIINLDPFPGNLILRFIRSDSTQIGSTKLLEIPANGKIYIDDQGFFQSLIVNPGDVVTEGWVEIVSDGARLAGSVIFGDPGRDTFSAALPLASQLETSVLFGQVATNETYFTGIAILNPNGTSAFATMDIFDTEGRLEFTRELVIPARGRLSNVLKQYFSDLDNRSSGYVRLIVDKPVASFSLFGTHDLRVLSAVPAQILP